MTPLVSIIVPTWNGRRYLEDAFRSIAVQRYEPTEIIVVDDASTDDSADIGGRYATRLIRRPIRGGVAAARNHGVSAAHGQVLAFLDQDDRWEPSTLRTHVDALSAHPEAISVVHERLYVEPGCDTPSWLGRQELLARPHAAFVPSGVAFTIETFRRIGPFDERFLHASDLDWFARARFARVPVHVTPRVLLHRRIHDANDSRHPRARRELVMTVHAALSRSRESDAP